MGYTKSEQGQATTFVTQPEVHGVTKSMGSGLAMMHLLNSIGSGLAMMHLLDCKT